MVRLRSSIGPVHPLPPLEALGGVGGKLRFDPENLGVGASGLDRGADAGGQTAAADRYQHVLDIREVVGDFQADRALPRDHIRMVEGRYQHTARLLQQLGGDLLAFTSAAQHHVRAVVTGGLHLDERASHEA